MTDWTWLMLASMSAAAPARRSSCPGLDFAETPWVLTRVSITSVNARTAPRAIPKVPDAIAALNMTPNIIPNRGEPGRRSAA